MGDWLPDKEEVEKEFGRRVRAARKALGLSQEKLGEPVGMHRTFIGAIERAESNPTLWTMTKLACLLRTDLTKLVEGLCPQLDDYPTRPTPTRSLRKTEA